MSFVLIALGVLLSCTNYCCEAWSSISQKRTNPQIRAKSPPNNQKAIATTFVVSSVAAAFFLGHQPEPCWADGDNINIDISMDTVVHHQKQQPIATATSSPTTEGSSEKDLLLALAGAEETTNVVSDQGFELPGLNGESSTAITELAAAVIAEPVADEQNDASTILTTEKEETNMESKRIVAETQLSDETMDPSNFDKFSVTVTELSAATGKEEETNEVVATTTEEAASTEPLSEMAKNEEQEAATESTLADANPPSQEESTALTSSTTPPASFIEEETTPPPPLVEEERVLVKTTTTASDKDPPKQQDHIASFDFVDKQERTFEEEEFQHGELSDAQIAWLRNH